eukprot:scaffold98718_cov63-Phaeocystis_antarctica.AAC.4
MCPLGVLRSTTPRDSPTTSPRRSRQLAPPSRGSSGHTSRGHTTARPLSWPLFNGSTAVDTTPPVSKSER